MREFLQEQIDAAEAALERAAAFESELKLGEAIRTLQAVRLPAHRDVTILSKRVEETLVRLQRGNERYSQDLEAGVARIRELIESRDYKRAVDMLDRIPAVLRTPETEALLEEANSKLQEVARLKAEIVAAVEKKQLLDVAPRIRRVLALQPESESMLRLAVKVRDSLLVAAAKQLKAFEYKRAWKIINAVPECVSDENTTALAGKITEFNWLVNDLQQAPIVDEPLLVIAKRFAKKAPGDQANLARCSKLFRLAAENPVVPSKRFPAVVWTPAPKRTHLGCDIDWLGGAEQVQFADSTVASRWHDAPGRYFVAVGLALQGLDVVPITTNLYKPEKQGLFGQLGISKRKGTTKRAWGIDIGDSALKVVRLVEGAGSAGLVVDGCELLPYSMPLSRPEAEAVRHKLIVESLGRFLTKYPLEKSDRICVSFPSQKVLGRLLRLPEATPKKRMEMVQYEAKQRIPIPLDELAWAYHAFASSPDNEVASTSVELPNTLLLAAKQRDIRELALIFEEVQIPLDIVQSDSVAIYNFAMFEGLAELAGEPSSETKSIALLDIGAAATNIVILTGDRPWFRSFRRGGDDFTSAAARHLHLTKEQAEQAKFDPSGIRRISEMYDAFDPLLAQLVDEIQRSLESFKKETGRDVSRILGMGGGFRLHGLLRYLRHGP